ncbi:MAG: STAS domain-containing protein [Actinomycetota bacterium]|nr:STAS domain-containing protein [Actinomycetota bacterium]
MFDVEVHDMDDGHGVCRLVGELDSFTVPHLHEALAGMRPTSPLIIDLSEVSFIDSAGLRALVGRIRCVRESGGEVAVCSCRPATNRALQLTGFDRFVPVVETREEAAELLGRDRELGGQRHADLGGCGAGRQ